MDPGRNALFSAICMIALSSACVPASPSPAGSPTTAGTISIRRTPSQSRTPTVTKTRFFSPTPTPPGYPHITLPDADKLAEIRRKGQAGCMRSGIFSKVGDSLTANGIFMVPFGSAGYFLGEYGYLQDVVDFFSRENARSGNSFVNESLAAQSGWRAEDALDPANAGSICQEGESPLSCEYRTVRPSMVVILLGTNDAAAPTGSYGESMRKIVVFALNRGIIPILTTLPSMKGTDVEPYNSIIRDLARRWDVPLIDLYAALAALPHAGLAPDGVHLSWIHPADFRPPNLEYGMTVRNLLALQALDAVWKSFPPEGGREMISCGG
jgi:hypothetical protein